MDGNNDNEKKRSATSCALMTLSRRSWRKQRRTFEDHEQEQVQQHDLEYLEDMGRQAWNEDGKARNLLQKFDGSLDNWGFYPKCLGTGKQVKKYGLAGTHYASGYTQLGEMVIRQGRDYSTWPRLVGLPCTPGNHQDRKPAAVSTVATAASMTGNTQKAQEEEEYEVPTRNVSPDLVASSTGKSDTESKNDTSSESNGDKSNRKIAATPRGTLFVTPPKEASIKNDDNAPAATLQAIEIKQKELAYKLDLFRGYRELKDLGMSNEQIAKAIPDMKLCLPNENA